MKQQIVRCRDCGHENPGEYRFCGMCGRSLPDLAPPFPPEAEEIPMPDFRRRIPADDAPVPSETSISGPSFLGIGDQSSTPEFNYLLEDESSHSAGRILVALILILGLAGAGYWQVRRHGGREWLYAVLRDPKLLTQSGKSADGVPADRLNRSKSALEQSTSNPNASKEADLQVQGGTLVSKDGKPIETQKSESQNSASPANAGGEASAKETPGASSDRVNAEEAARKQPASEDKDTEDRGTSKEETADRSEAAVRRSSAEAPSRGKPSPRSGAEQASAKESDTSQSGNDAADSSVRVAEKYLYGQGVPQDCGRALTLLRPAAEASNAKARSLLGTMYATGHCVPRDLPSSYHWLALALREEPNNRWLSRDLQSVWNQMSDSEKQTAMRMNR